MDELMHVEMLNKDNILFDEKFNDLKKFYIFDDERRFTISSRFILESFYF